MNFKVSQDRSSNSHSKPMGFSTPSAWSQSPSVDLQYQALTTPQGLCFDVFRVPRAVPRHRLVSRQGGGVCRPFLVCGSLGLALQRLVKQSLWFGRSFELCRFRFFMLLRVRQVLIQILGLWDRLGQLFRSEFQEKTNKHLNRQSLEASYRFKTY